MTKYIPPIWSLCDCRYLDPHHRGHNIACMHFPPHTLTPSLPLHHPRHPPPPPPSGHHPMFHPFSGPPFTYSNITRLRTHFVFFGRTVNLTGVTVATVGVTRTPKSLCRPPAIAPGACRCQGGRTRRVEEEALGERGLGGGRGSTRSGGSLLFRR